MSNQGIDFIKDIEEKLKSIVKIAGGFGISYFPNYKRPKHVKYFEKIINKLTYEKGLRYIIVMPPRHGKSVAFSVILPSFYLVNNPNKKVLLASYSYELASDFAYRVKSLLKNNNLVEFTIERIDNFETTIGSGLFSAGVGGSITGKGASLLILDDPIKNAEEANSKHMRDKIYEWFNSTFLTRAEPDANIVIIQTRWHEDDLAGRILNDKEESKKWTVLHLPALAEENDLLGRKVGEALWPERYDEQKLREIQKTIGSYWFSALYQGRPTPAEGKIFKRSLFRYYEEDENYYILKTDTVSKRVEKSKCSVFQTVDTAATEKQTSDYFVIATWGITPDRELVLLDIFRERIDTTKHNRIIKDYYLKYQPFLICIEEKTFGLTIIQQLKSELPIKPLKADVDKVARALVIAAKYENGLVYHPIRASWLADYESELLEFPNSAYDDQVDCAGYAGFILQDYVGEVYYSVRGRLRDDRET